MKGVELYGRVRYAVQIEGLSHREAAREFGIDPRTVAKMVKFSVPPGYVRKKPPARPKLDPFILVIDGILLERWLKWGVRPSLARKIEQFVEKVVNQLTLQGMTCIVQHAPQFKLIAVYHVGYPTYPDSKVHVAYADST